jgi:dTDP-4-dehydrorhamnose reductase
VKLNDKTRILITGCGGMLGDAFYNLIKNKYTIKATDIDLNREWIEYLDVRNYDQFKREVEIFKPEIILHLAALTDLEYCEKNIENTYSTNTTSVENAVILANNIGATLVYISTAGIFDGEKNEYDDWDLPNPINIYGRSKYMGELYVEKNMDKYFVFRAGWMMGGGIGKDKKFVNKIIKKIQNGERELNVVDDKLGTPTYTYDFAKNVFNMLKTNYYGVYNLVCDDDCSRYDVACEMLRILKLDKKIKINIVSSDYFKKEYFAPRPNSEKLICNKLRLRDEYIMRDWRISLKEYLQSSYSNL